MRGKFNAYFLILAIAGVVATLAFALEGRLAVAICIAQGTFGFSRRHLFRATRLGAGGKRHVEDRPWNCGCRSGDVAV
jgi:hypothetical protein